MAVEPSEDTISMVVEVTQASRETALRYLRIKNNDIGSTISAILDGEDIQAAEAAQTWDDSAWTTDREGGLSMSQTIPFNDSNIRPLGSSAAPTRGSSPVPSFRQPETRAEEDEALARALANSQQFTYGEQETGVMTDSKGFRPATNAHYDPSQWAMTVPESNVHHTREIVPDVEATERRHLDGHPRFLKQLPSSDYLSSLLTIAYHIPAAREALLMRSHLQPNYGFDSDWWKGQSIKLPRIVSTVTFDSLDPAAQLDDDLINEMQRVVAFLDASFRSYACLDNLTSIASQRARNQEVAPDTIADKVLSGWEGAARRVLGDASEAPGLFHSVVGTTHPSARQTRDFWSLPLTISDEDRRRPGDTTLADIMDNALWKSDADDQDMYDTFMERCADVLPMRITQDGTAHSNLGVIVPAQFHVDKYLKQNIGAFRVVRKQMAATRKRIADLDALHQGISSIPHPSGSGFIDAAELLKLTRGMLAGHAHEAVLAEYEARGADLPSGSLEISETEKAKNEAIAAKLQDLAEKIESKLAVLQQEKDKACEMLSKLSQETPAELGEGSLRYRYTLRGVSTKPGVTYVLQRKPKSADEDLMDTGSDALRPPRENDENLFEDLDAPPGWRWWRIDFDPSRTPARIMETESTQDDVLRAVELEHSSALLVYASDRAMEADEDPQLPEPLQEFVDADNAVYQREINQFWSAPSTSREGWGFGGVTVQTHSRRSSQGSTMVNYDMGDRSSSGGMQVGHIEDAPAYSFDPPAYSYEPPAYERISSPDAHEIRLGDEDEGEDMTEAEKAALRGGNRHSVVMGESPPASPPK